MTIHSGERPGGWRESLDDRWRARAHRRRLRRQAQILAGLDDDRRRDIGLPPSGARVPHPYFHW